MPLNATHNSLTHSLVPESLSLQARLAVPLELVHERPDRGVHVHAVVDDTDTEVVVAVEQTSLRGWVVIEWVGR